MPAIPLFCLDPSLIAAAEAWALRLGATVVSGERKALLRDWDGRVDWALVLDADGLGLQALERPAPGVVRADLASGAMQWRLQHGGGRGEQVAKACGVRGHACPSILDATAGLGRDSLILASLGCAVVMCERSPIVAALLEDGLRRAALQLELAPILARMRFLPQDAAEVLSQLDDYGIAPPDVVYLDPMFPHRDKQALVKKEMRVFRQVVGDDTDDDRLLTVARAVAHKRVVVKRPRHAPHLAGVEPTQVLEGQSGRFDIYLPA